jgi:hypothetical protein
MGELAASLGLKGGCGAGAWALPGTLRAVSAAALPSTEVLRKSLREVE